MNISLDAGALCIPNHSFGNATFAANLIEAVKRYDKKNKYIAYTFCNFKKNEGNVVFKALYPKQFFMKGAVPFEEIKNPKDIFLALNQAMPWVTRSRIFSFSHGLSFLNYPHYYHDSARLKKQLQTMVERSEKLFVSSDIVKEQLLALYPTASVVRAVFGVPFDMLAPKKQKVEDYFLYVGMDSPIKNINFVIDAFTAFRTKKGFGHYKLFLIGNFEPQTKQKNIYAPRSVNRERLKSLYASATAYLSASHYESFNFPIVEALVQGCPVVAKASAVIPELQPYVTVANEKEQFVEEMVQSARSKKRFQKSAEIQRYFSWKNYIRTITSHYD